MERCRGGRRSPLLFIIKQNLVNRTQWVLNSVCGGADPHTPGFFCVPKRNQKGTAQTPRRLWCGSQKLAPIQVQWKILVTAKITVNTDYKLNFSFLAWLEEHFKDPQEALPAFEENVFGTFLHYQKGTRPVGGGTPTNKFTEQILFYIQIVGATYGCLQKICSVTAITDGRPQVAPTHQCSESFGSER